MQLATETYLTKVANWPQTGRQMLAQFDENSVVVCPAYNRQIGNFAASNGYLGGEFKLTRMSWIKTNFMWMMYRSGWGPKIGQEITLAVTIKRTAFEEILSKAVPSKFIPHIYRT